MTEAIVAQDFFGKPDDEAMARAILVGETLTGELAEVAIAEGWAFEAFKIMPTETEKPKKGKK